MENKGLEYVKNQIVKLKDDLQHYTMVEKDSVLASQIRYDLEQFVIIEKELKAKDNLVSMCENLAKLVGLKEKDYVELETIITKKLKALEIIKSKKWLVDIILGYCAGCDSVNKTATYDLLKEVLEK